MTHPSRTGGQILVDALHVHGVDIAFGVPGESYLDVLDALAVYTAGSAHATGEAAIKGRLTPGRLADFVVLDADLTAVDPGDIASVGVRSTWVGGSCVWAA